MNELVILLCSNVHHRSAFGSLDCKSVQTTIREFTVDFGAAKILCVELDLFVLESRCAILKMSGYDSMSTSPQLAEILLRSQKFDLIVLSMLSDSDLHRIVNFSDGAEVLVLEELIMPSELLSLVAQRLNGHQRRA
jgi:hypothetical protein